MVSAQAIPWWTVDLGKPAAEAAYTAVINKHLSYGDISKSVENDCCDLLDVKYALLTSSGSAAITLALLASGVKAGDSVVCPGYTWIATAHAAHLLGCKIILADIESTRPVIDIKRLPDANRNLRYILPVHINGHHVDISAIKAKGYIVVEDAAQAIGSRSRQNRYLGTEGHIGCFSFSMTKTVCSGQGGLLVTNDDRFYESARKIRTHGIDNLFDPKKWGEFGHNFRYNDIAASVLKTQFYLLNKRINSLYRVSASYANYLHGCRDISLVNQNSQSEFGPYIEAQTSKRYRDALIHFLAKCGIDSRPAYPSLASAKYLNHEILGNSLTNTNEWSAKTLYLPSGPDISNENIQLVCDRIKMFFKTKT